MRSEDELLKIPAENFPYDMTDSEQDVWLRSVPESWLHTARRCAAALQPERIIHKITEGKFFFPLIR